MTAETQRRPIVSQLLTALLVAVILGSIGMLAYNIATADQTQDKFTEFYLLDQFGGSQHYPQQVSLGENVTVSLGITNHDDVTVNYDITVTADGAVSNVIGPVTLPPGENREMQTRFQFDQSGPARRVEFKLTADLPNFEAQTLYLIIDVLP